MFEPARLRGASPFTNICRLSVRLARLLSLWILWLTLPIAYGSSLRGNKGGGGVLAADGGAAPGRFLERASEEDFSTYQMAGDGDLWPTCWADDDNLYTANGDGAGFSGSAVRPDLVVSRITGVPPGLQGTSLATDVGTNWSGPGFNRKPTGMLCVHSALYLAFQNLDAVGFNSAPAASIARSTDHGVTWTWDRRTPMFGGPGRPPLFTTVFFLDFGRNSNEAIDGYVYAYGLDNNWRSQQALYLARVRADRVQRRRAWRFYVGMDEHGRARWSKEIGDKEPVLLDKRLTQPHEPGTGCPTSDSVIAQGGVVYDRPLNRYLFTSWSCTTHELYEAPAPWGPWTHVLSNDFGSPMSPRHRGQYGTTIPSKFISADGRKLSLQSNVCCAGDSYTFSLRELLLDVAASR